MRRIVATDNAPAAIGPYAQANVVDNLVFTSGQIPLDPATGELVEGGIQEQTHRVFLNLAAVLEEAGTNLGNVVKTTCFLSNIDDFTAMNQVYGEYFPKGIFPSRSAFQVAALPKGALVEIEAIALLK
ncbi:RidA family protein [Eubacterium sp. AB3007]|uniref:RidA family protein n=1 Tax=Eubacterium sp. AB3007 TaxID=1392487 RepID=UPI000484B6E4